MNESELQLKARCFDLTEANAQLKEQADQLGSKFVELARLMELPTNEEGLYHIDDVYVALVTAIDKGKSVEADVETVHMEDACE